MKNSDFFQCILIFLTAFIWIMFYKLSHKLKPSTFSDYNLLNKIGKVQIFFGLFFSQRLFPLTWKLKAFMLKEISNFHIIWSHLLFPREFQYRHQNSDRERVEKQRIGEFRIFSEQVNFSHIVYLDYIPKSWVIDCRIFEHSQLAKAIYFSTALLVHSMKTVLCICNFCSSNF